MPKKIGTPLEKKFRLDRWDKEGDTEIMLRQAKQGAFEFVSSVKIGTSQVYADPRLGRVEVKTPANRAEVIRRMAEATMIGCNILGEDDQPLFRFKQDTATGRHSLDMTSGDFFVAWSKLDPEIVDEMHEKILEINPMWGPEGEV